MNVLIHCDEQSISYKSYYALVPSNLLQDYDLDAINGHDDGDSDAKIGGQISMILDRLGLVPIVTSEEWNQWLEKKKDIRVRVKFDYPPFKSEQDLKQFLNPVPPFTVDKIISISSIA